MYPTIRRQRISPEDLVDLLGLCADQLNRCCQETPSFELWATAMQASMMCERLRLEQTSDAKSYLIH